MRKVEYKISELDFETGNDSTKINPGGYSITRIDENSKS